MGRWQCSAHQSADPLGSGVSNTRKGGLPPLIPPGHGPRTTADRSRIFDFLGKVGLKCVTEVPTLVNVSLKGVNAVATS